MVCRFVPGLCDLKLSHIIKQHELHSFIENNCRNIQTLSLIFSLISAGSYIYISKVTYVKLVKKYISMHKIINSYTSWFQSFY